MKLNALERVVIISILPSEGNYLTMSISKDLAKRIDLTAKDMQTYNIRQEGNVTYYDNLHIRQEFDISSPEQAIIVKALVDLNSAEKIKGDHTDLYKRFVLGDYKDTEDNTLELEQSVGNAAEDIKKTKKGNK
jgi:hypothetical protein